MLLTLVALLAATAIAVPLTRRAGFGSVLGYLLAGIAIGPGGLRLVTNIDEISSIASLGVVMLLFLIGLELRPQRLWVMRRAVFGLGSAQLVISAAALASLAHLAGIGWAGAIVLGAGLAMSSTAIVLPMLAERELLTTRAGRDGFAVLLFQDLAFIPLVALVPLLSGTPLPNQVPWLDVARAAAAIAVILVGGRFLLRPLFRAIGGAKTPEVFTAVALLIVVGAATLATLGGLSPSLGAFMAGVLLSESEYRHELEADIAPFEGLLLGFFFISVGMSADLSLALARPGVLIGGTAALLAVKAAIAFAIGRGGRQDIANALRFALALPQASEFSFVLFASAVAVGAMAPSAAAMATLVTAASMLATPILFAASERWVIPRLTRAAVREYDTIDAAPAPVIICGFGRVGQIVGRILRMHGIAFTALERDPGQVDVVRRFGNKVYFGDPTRADVLRAAGAETAKLLVVALDDMEATLRVVDVAKRNFPGLRILARARNRRHAFLLMDRGIYGLVRETFHSSLELGRLALTGLGIAEGDAEHAVALFRDHDEKTLVANHAVYRDETKLIQNTRDAAEELESLFEADRAGQPTSPATAPT
ncbi:MAG TPA: monovalent cation:proton antiporter-2 (CPA2) family protein [Acetobacteraceae bacterium]|jgi:monovalent cation:proton antiporter-2 (CPA2) family protein|nr:monovalent cation:proton antiporter-2 (CPA2) family protein [Acetobacteraceae bacterium]